MYETYTGSHSDETVKKSWMFGINVTHPNKISARHLTSAGQVNTIQKLGGLHL